MANKVDGRHGPECSIAVEIKKCALIVMSNNVKAGSVASLNADLFSGLTILFLVLVVLAALALFFGWTCTSGTFKSNAFSVSNCFVVPGLFTSNVAVTAPALPPDAPCAEWNMF